MATGTCDRESCSDVRWGTGFVKLFRVAVVAIRRCAFVFPASVAGLAVESGVSPSESEAGKSFVGKFGAQPTVLGMARVASLRKIQSHVIGIRGFLELGQMACRTIWQNAVLPADEGFVARFAFCGGMGAEKRKEILMISNLGEGSKPSLHDMAGGAVRTKLTQVNISVAIRTVLSNIRKN